MTVREQWQRCLGLGLGSYWLRLAACPGSRLECWECEKRGEERQARRNMGCCYHYIFHLYMTVSNLNVKWLYWAEILTEHHILRETRSSARSHCVTRHQECLAQHLRSRWWGQGPPSLLAAEEFSPAPICIRFLNHNIIISWLIIYLHSSNHQFFNLCCLDCYGLKRIRLRILTQCMNKHILGFYLWQLVFVSIYVVFMKRENFFNLDIWYDVIVVCVAEHRNQI